MREPSASLFIVLSHAVQLLVQYQSNIFLFTSKGIDLDMICRLEDLFEVIVPIVVTTDDVFLSFRLLYYIIVMKWH